MNVSEMLTNWLPATVLAESPEIIEDDDELLIVLNLGTAGVTGEADARKQSEQEQIDRRRDETKSTRIRIGNRLGRATGKAVSWGMKVGDTRQLFTDNTSPVMTRLSRPERQVLDTLIAAGVANTRSAALGYIVRVFGEEHQDWLNEVQNAMSHVASLRDKLRPQQRQGPPPTTASGDAETPVYEA